MVRIGLVAGSLLGLGTGAQGQAAAAVGGQGSRWVVDIVHSQIDFRVSHLVGRVRGTFTDWYAVIRTSGPDWTTGSVSVRVQTSSLNTGNSYRDADLRSNEFFAVDSFPVLSFEGGGIQTGPDSSITISGVVTIKGHSKPVTLSGQYRGIARDAEGHERIGFEATTSLDRMDFGIGGNTLVNGTHLIGKQVDLTIALEAVQVD
jgi:polyisoprenoid-binding protein YceI